MKRLGVSGGTAPFFSLKLCNPENGMNEMHYIGKDLSRAKDEVDFYEQLKNNEVSRDALGNLRHFLFDYLGILKTKEEGISDGTSVDVDEESELDLLVIQNLHDGKEKLRLLDIKVGETTASANWRGKSRLRAMRQQAFDRITNSAVEGYRLEGFDGCPASLLSRQTFLEILSGKDGKLGKKSRRFLYQNLDGMEILQYFMDLDDGDSKSKSQTQSPAYGVDEYLEIIMHEIVKLLVQLSILCCRVKVPQKWIGSSLAIGFDCGAIPSRSMSEEDIRKNVIVKFSIGVVRD